MLLEMLHGLVLSQQHWSLDSNWMKPVKPKPCILFKKQLGSWSIHFYPHIQWTNKVSTLITCFYFCLNSNIKDLWDSTWGANFSFFSRQLCKSRIIYFTPGWGLSSCLFFVMLCFYRIDALCSSSLMMLWWQ